MSVNSNEEKKIALSYECLAMARDVLVMNMRFLDVALLKLPFEAKKGLRGMATDGKKFYFDPDFVLNAYRIDKNIIARTYLHSLLHEIFCHRLEYEGKRQHLYDLACDITIENIIMDLEVSAVTLKDDNLRRERLRGLKKNLGQLTAKKIYKHFLIYGIAADDDREYSEFFTRDSHIYFTEPETLEISENEWKKLAQKVKTDIHSFSKTTGNSESLLENLTEAAKEKVDYTDILKRFVTMGESTTINDEEFDYIYYTYGMNTYGNVPLIEPLEYKDVQKIKDFAIVLDTSASCNGDTLKTFLRHTYNIMKSTDNFFSSVNVHIIQSDNDIRSDTKITSAEDFEAFIKTGNLNGFGGTDFRPAFNYIDSLIEKGEFTDFKGMIYFTDGFGIYPELAPKYDTMFVYLNDGTRKIEAPWWVIKVELLKEDIDEYKTGEGIY